MSATSNIGVFPATVQAVIDRAGGFIRGGGHRVMSAPMAYAGEVERDNSCFNCGKEGHWARECPKKRSTSGGVAKDGEQANASADANHTSGDSSIKPESTKKKNAKKKNGCGPLR